MSENKYDLNDIGKKLNENNSYDLSDISLNSNKNNSFDDQNQKSTVPSVDTLLGKMQNQSNPQIKNQFLKFPSQEEMQKAGSMILPLVAPELKAIPFISNAISKIPGIGKMIGNTLTRIGYGTALNTAPDLFSKEGRENIGEHAKTNALLNTGIEGLTLPFRGASKMAELFNPIKYARGKASEIKNEYDAAKTVMEHNYKPINEAYGNFNVTVTPGKYLKDSGINRKKLYNDAKEYYDEFKKEPTYKNLINLKSQVGRDWAKISPSDKVNKIQLFNRYKNTLDSKIQNFLSRDEKMLNQYNLANKYAENVFYPYLSTPTLNRISKGKFETIYPEKMANSLEKASQRVVGQEYKYRIPEEHPLRNHLKDLKNRIAIGDVSESVLPSLAGGIIGEMIHPGIGGISGGISSGVGTSLASKMARSKLLKYPVVQSPSVENAFKKMSPLYYKGARSLAGYPEENK